MAVFAALGHALAVEGGGGPGQLSRLGGRVGAEEGRGVWHGQQAALLPLCRGRQAQQTQARAPRPEHSARGHRAGRQEHGPAARGLRAGPVIRSDKIR